MKKSISTKLFIGVAAIGIVFVLSSWILNYRYLEKFYVKEKKDTLLESSKKIDELYNGSPKDVITELREIETETGSYILILNNKGKIKYNSFFDVLENGTYLFNEENTRKFNNKKHRNIMGQRPLPIPPPPKQNELINGKYVFTIQKSPLLPTEFMVLRYILSNEDMLISVTSLATITKSARISNRLLLYTGLFIVGVGLILVYLFSIRFTKPILQINNVVRDIAKLDFKNKCIIKTDDEIGELARSINFVSEKLENTISQLNEKNKKLEEDILRERRIDEMRKEFISNVSHELKTPIALIQGYAEGLKSNVANSEEDKDFYFEVIIDETRKMDSLVKDLLNLSQLEAGQQTLEKQRFNINTLICRVIQKYEPILQEKKIRLIYGDKNHIEVLGDELKIEQVMINYINNAINHANHQKLIKIYLQDFNNKLRITVFNTGNPMPEESINKIWDSFYKVDKARTRKYGGSGLGLSIVKGIMNLHGNSFGAHNVENGVEFWFELYKTKTK